MLSLIQAYESPIASELQAILTQDKLPKEFLKSSLIKICLKLQ